MQVYTIEVNSIYGRYMVACKDIKQGELILKERPVVIGPPIAGSHVCFRCCKLLKSSIQVCAGCRVATLCAKDCDGPNHTLQECSALKSSGLTVPDLITRPQIITPLRCLLIRSYDPELWQRLISMEAHLDRRRGTPIWETNEEYVEKPLRDLGQASSDDSQEETVQKICGVLDVNSFEVRPKGSDSLSEGFLRALYIEASLMTHDCVGNTSLSVDDDFLMTVYAKKDIPSGETIFFNYGDCLKGTRDRRLHLLHGKYFECACRRCSDPSELGTHLSSMKCSKCRTGLVTPTIPLSDVFETSWSCQNCATVYKGKLIQSTLERIKEKMSWDRSNLLEGEKLLRWMESNLSPNHYFILELKQDLIPLYEPVFTDWAMGRKIAFCKDILEVLHVLEPGISRLQGLALFQLHSAQVNFANKSYQSQETSPSKYLESLREAETNLTESVKHLLYEPTKSPEGRLTKHALNDLKILRSTIRQIEELCRTKLRTEDDLLKDLVQKKRMK